MERTGSSVRVFKDGREKEVVEIMNILFDQEYAMERRMMSREIAEYSGVRVPAIRNRIPANRIIIPTCFYC